MEGIELLKELSKPLPIDGRQKTDRRKTYKSYDTDGYGYQWCIDRFNNALGESWGFEWEIINTEKKTSSTNKPQIEIVVSVGIWVHDRHNIRKCVGGHTSGNYVDALKGAITSGFKKTAAFWGVGCDAYRGTIDHPYIDDDNQPFPEDTDEKSQSNPPATKSNGNDHDGKSGDNKNGKLTGKLLMNQFINLAYPLEFIAKYHAYCYQKYGKELPDITDYSILSEQNNIIGAARNCPESWKKFQDHLSKFKTDSEPPQATQSALQQQTTKPPVATSKPSTAIPKPTSTTSVGNGTETGLRRRINAKLDLVFGRSSKAINAWLVDNFGTDDLNSMSLGALQNVFAATDKKFNEYRESVKK